MSKSNITVSYIYLILIMISWHEHINQIARVGASSVPYIFRWSHTCNYNFSHAYIRVPVDHNYRCTPSETPRPAWGIFPFFFSATTKKNGKKRSGHARLIRVRDSDTRIERAEQKQLHCTARYGEQFKVTEIAREIDKIVRGPILAGNRFCYSPSLSTAYGYSTRATASKTISVEIRHYS